MSNCPVTLVNGGPTVVIETRPTTVLVQQIPGVGPPGPAASDMTVTALTALGGHRVVTPTAGGWVHADPGTPAHAHGAVAVTTGAISAGQTGAVRQSGEIVEPSWSWTPGLPVFCGANGVPTQSPPSSGWVRVIGVATSATALVVAPESPITLI